MPDSDNMGGAGLAFLLAEFRDLRKGMENRDGSLRVSIDGIREDVKELAISVDRSRGEVDAMRGDVETVKTDLHALRSDVDDIQKASESDRIRRESSWSGPRRLIQILVLLGTAAAAILALINFGPSVMLFFATG